ncbi:D-alanyl-D-alanine carboxypeptidase/D-alanyl-D-alanine-endopeptidase [Thiomicrorhabdus xiamenensis]|uniref:D-alanyl-D-alanine carboxypeptidase n=1 Tax=Thiomicrorhabdus xiamenensis TaxID=2739063 RepID=A0A7D4NQH9_9GAMM|nr:D-alanyl-D-alanine carboxypeptidase [Thiomicrorhabdus xiamenensis]QKI88690.1 D-alanyl-D-alanine carboxypeptidase [Thiomicrorhabdus xiamenensis]
MRSILRIFRQAAVSSALLLSLAACASTDQLHFSGKEYALYKTLNPAALLIATPDGEPLFADHADQPLIPASTTKLITALLALRHWGEDYRFYTDFSVRLSPGDAAPVLQISAYGDPFLVSEEMALLAGNLATRLRAQGIKRLSQIQLVNQWFETDIRLPGTGESLNPYDAVNGAFAVNFNSIKLRKDAGGWSSAEEQTPMTATSKRIAEQSGLTLKVGQSERINIGKDDMLNRQYAAEILIAFLQREGVEVEHAELQSTPLSGHDGAPEILRYRHYNSRTLAEVIRPMMKYSTNFIANQIALNLSADLYGAPASAAKLQKLYAEQLPSIFGWKRNDVHFLDGAGLSRDNSISALQLMAVLQAFEPWRHLLPEVEEGVYAKSGSLIGVSTLAGYLHHHQQWLPFVFLSNQRVPYHFRNRLAKSLKAQLPREFILSQQ